MKKLQSIFAVLAVVVGITGALAFTPKSTDPCAGATLYYFDGSIHRQITDGGGSSCDLITDPYCKYYNAGTPESPNFLPCTDPSCGTGRYQGN